MSMQIVTTKIKESFKLEEQMAMYLASKYTVEDWIYWKCKIICSI